MTSKLMHGRLELPAITGQALSTIDRAIACGDLSTVLVGRKRFATPIAVQKWVDFLASESNAGRPVRYMARDLAERRTPERAKAERTRQRRRA